MGQSQNHTIQCVLLLNIFTEKVFIILWAWYSILSAVTFCNLLSWIYALFNDRSTEHFILNHLEMSGERVFSNDCPKGLTAIQIQVERYFV
jgi:innexin